MDRRLKNGSRIYKNSREIWKIINVCYNAKTTILTLIIVWNKFVYWNNNCGRDKNEDVL